MEFLLGGDEGTDDDPHGAETTIGHAEEEAQHETQLGTRVEEESLVAGGVDGG